MPIEKLIEKGLAFMLPEKQLLNMLNQTSNINSFPSHGITELALQQFSQYEQDIIIDTAYKIYTTPEPVSTVLTSALAYKTSYTPQPILYEQAIRQVFNCLLDKLTSKRQRLFPVFNNFFLIKSSDFYHLTNVNELPLLLSPDMLSVIGRIVNGQYDLSRYDLSRYGSWKKQIIANKPYKRSLKTLLKANEENKTEQAILASSLTHITPRQQAEPLPQSFSKEEPFSFEFNATFDPDLYKEISAEWNLISFDFPPSAEEHNAHGADSLGLGTVEEKPLDATSTPDQATLFNQVGHTYEKSGKLMEAYQHFLMSDQLSFDPSTKIIAEAGIKLCLLRMGNELLLASKIKEAELYYQAAMLPMLDLEVHYALVEKAYQCERWELALEQVQVIQMLFPQELNVYHHLKYLYQQHAKLAQIKGNKALYDEYMKKAEAAALTLVVETHERDQLLNKPKRNQKEERVDAEKTCFRSNTAFSSGSLYASLYGNQQHFFFTTNTKRKESQGLQAQKQSREKRPSKKVLFAYNG